MMDSLIFIKENNPEEYDKLEAELYEIAEGKKLNKMKAVEWVESMNPKAKWTYEDIEKIDDRIGIPTISAYCIMNMLYSDYSEVLGSGDTPEELENYIKLTREWYKDTDTSKKGEEKLYCYYKNIVK